MDCRKSTFAVHEIFQLTDRVWRRANPLIVGILCLDCVEKRLGRLLHATDFAPSAINVNGAQVCKDLAERLVRAPAPTTARRRQAWISGASTRPPKTPLGRASAALLPFCDGEGRVPPAVIVRLMRQQRFVQRVFGV